ncbi:hypothetical protein HDU87_005203 [Geranomyces variabilis]|uniref:NADP-dependent oxidoreductase domain-containing protein n=1 Tax=Geranomyces variabilis TaxID=109894 RepID=A0AAD5TJN6_9FUNG|nr:hypothetical protein HDU87_005203 [Geranomyces variabilis]
MSRPPVSRLPRSPPSVQRLSNGVEMPVLGLGTYRLRGAICTSTVKAAICAGYRLIDTATAYRNEEDVGAAIAELAGNGTVSRKDLFLTTKISPKDQGEERSYAAVLTSLEKLGPSVDYLDLVLIHWPGTAGLKVSDPQNPANRRGSWRALERLYSEGRVRAIGVSNFLPHHLDDLATHSTITPHVMQFEFHPAVHTEAQPLLDYLRAHQIVPQAYSSFGEGALLDPARYPFPELHAIAAARLATPAQVLLAWALTRGVSVVPKTKSVARLAENLAAVQLELGSDEMRALDQAFAEKTERFCWNPAVVV